MVLDLGGLGLGFRIWDLGFRACMGLGELRCCQKKSGPVLRVS